MLRINKHDISPVKDLLVKVREWYCGAFPTDILGREIPDDLTLWDVVAALNIGLDVYTILGSASDSVVRERIFRRIAEIMKVHYDTVYSLWLET